jgi:predicted GNAT superfamily acetyltransferase
VLAGSVTVTDPWTLAEIAAKAAAVSLRALDAPHDGDAVNRVIDGTWGGQHVDHEIIRALGFSGNLVWGAESGGELIGFALGWAGVDEEGLHVHSHMVATLPDRRHAGVGFALKLAQRAAALDKGIEVMRWTFDPMIARNAWFNLGKLGTLADGFFADFYGAMTDAINAGDRSDRLVTRWMLRREPGPWRCTVGEPERVPIPAEYPELRAAEPAAAATERDRVRAALERSFSTGLITFGFDRATSSLLLAREGDVA